MLLDVSFVDQPIHVLITVLVCLFDLKIEQLTVVYSEATVQTAHSHYFVDHIQLVRGNFTTHVLVSDQIGHILVL